MTNGTGPLAFSDTRDPRLVGGYRPVLGTFLSTYPEVQARGLSRLSPVDIVSKVLDAGIGQRYRSAG